MMELPARARNTMLAGALGEVWAGVVEGRPSAQPALFAASRTLSDDTWLALATCEAIARHGAGVRAAAIAAVFREWFAQKRFPGIASPMFDAPGNPAWAASPSAAGETPPVRGGVALRAAPLAFVMDPRVEIDRGWARDAIGITHQDGQAWGAALTMMHAIQICLEADGVPPSLPALLVERLPDTPVRERLIAFDRAMPEAGSLDGASQVDDVVALAAVTAARSGDTLDGALSAAAAFGGEDVLVALVGQLAGASGLVVPATLAVRIPERDEIEPVLQRFVDGVTGAMA